MNLFSNAIKFSDKNGKIKIQVEKSQEESESITVSVIDSGLGIKKKDQGKLFKLFGSIKHEQKKVNMNGIGLGLVISKLLVEKFNGKIDFKSKYKQGTTFFFTWKCDPVDPNSVA